MVGQLSHRRGAARPARRVDNSKGIRSNYGNIKKKIVAKAVNQARRNGVRASLQNMDRAEHLRPGRRNPPGMEKRLELEEPKLAPGPRRRPRRRPQGDKPLESSVTKLQEEPRRRVRRPMNKLGDMEPSGSKMPERPGSRVVRGNFRMKPRRVDKPMINNGEAERIMNNSVPRRAEGRRRDRGPPERRVEEAPRMARRSPPRPFQEERRPVLQHREPPPRPFQEERRPGAHREPPPVHHPFAIREEPHRMRHEEPRGPQMRRSPPRQMYPPRMQEESRGRRELPMPPMEKEPMFYERFKEPRRIPESGRSMAVPPERDSALRRHRSPQRNKRVSRTEREEDLIKRPRDGPSRQTDQHYSHLESSRMIPRGLEVLHRRPAPERGPHYPGRGLDRPPIGLDYPRARSITPPSLRLMKAFPPRGHIRELESDLRLMRSGRRDEYPHGREPIHPPFEFGRERVRMDSYVMSDLRLPSRRSMEREMERRDREWHQPPLPRFAGTVSTRGRSAERNNSRYMPGSNYHFDPLSRR